MGFITNAVNYRLDRRVGQLGNKHQEQAADKQGTFNRGVSHPEAERKHDNESGNFLAEGRFMFKGGLESEKGITKRVDDSPDSGGARFRHDIYWLVAGVNFRFSSRAAFTSSRRLTGKV